MIPKYIHTTLAMWLCLTKQAGKPAMIKIGGIVEARVYREEQYGVYLRCESGEILVLVPELSWAAGGPANTRGLMDHMLRVLVTGYNPGTGRWYGSVKKAEPGGA